MRQDEIKALRAQLKALQELEKQEKANRPKKSQKPYKVYPCVPYEPTTDEDGLTYSPPSGEPLTEVPKSKKEEKFLLTEKGFVLYHINKLKFSEVNEMFSKAKEAHPDFQVSITDNIFLSGSVSKDDYLRLIYQMVVGRQVDKLVFPAKSIVDRRKKTKTPAAEDKPSAEHKETMEKVNAEL
jgi:hypothetical protein